MAAPIVTQGTSLEAQFVEVARALAASVAATPAAQRGNSSASVSSNFSAKQISVQVTLDGDQIVDDQAVGIVAKNHLT
jgi:hypothetical protein